MEERRDMPARRLGITCLGHLQYPRHHHHYMAVLQLPVPRHTLQARSVLHTTRCFVVQARARHLRIGKPSGKTYMPEYRAELYGLAGLGLLRAPAVAEPRSFMRSSLLRLACTGSARRVGTCCSTTAMFSGREH